MENLVQAAVQAAAQSGIRATLVILDGTKNGAAPAAPASSSADEDALRSQLAAAHEEARTIREAAQGLQQQVAQLKAGNPQVLVEACDARDAALKEVAHLQGVTMDLQNELTTARQAPASAAPDQATLARIAELEGALAESKLNLVALEQHRVEVAEKQGSDDPAVVASFINEPLSVLGAEAKVEKGLQKVGCKTIGDVRTKYLTEAETLKKEGRLTKDDMISIGVLLAGKAPSMSHAPSAAPAAAAAPAPAGGSPANIPPGLDEDRAWDERLKAARSKEVRLTATQAKLDELHAKAKAEHPDAVDPDGKVNLDKLAVVNLGLAGELRNETNTFNVVRGQKIAMLWACNLPVNEETIDRALETKGVAQPVGV